MNTKSSFPGSGGYAGAAVGTGGYASTSVGAAGNGHAAIDQPVREHGDVVEAFANNARAADRLLTAVVDLRVRLADVLMPSPPTPMDQGGLKSIDISRSPLASRVHNATGTLCDAEAVLGDILQRLEV